MKIAVLMSTYNGEKYLREQIESILYQDGDFDLDLWVRDDKSTDSTVQILKEYEKKGKLRWYTGENMGPGKSFIDLLYNVKNYDYYAFSDQDDVWEKEKIKSGIEMIKEYEGEVLYFCNAEYVDKKLKPLGGYTYKKRVPVDNYSAILNPGYLGCTMIFNSKLVKIIQDHQEPNILFMHDAYLSRVCVSVGGTIIYDNNSHIKYRQHESNVIGSTTGKMDAIKRRIEMIKTKPNVSASNELLELRSIYEDKIGKEQNSWINEIINYKSSLFSKLKIILSNKPKYISKNMRFTICMKILLGNL